MSNLIVAASDASIGELRHAVVGGANCTDADDVIIATLEGVA